MKNKKTLLSFLAISVLLLLNNNSVPFWDQDEPAYAGFAFNMLEKNQWIIPDFPFSDVHRKPPLHFWLIAFFNLIFGYNEFAVRFSSSLAIFGVLLLVYFQGRKFFSEQTAIYTVWILSGSFLVTAIAKIGVTDATVLFFMTLCAFGLLHVLFHRSKKWVFLFWLSIALGTLTKGPPVLFFAIFFGTLLFLFHAKRKNLILLHPWLFLPVALLPFSAWAYFTYLQDGGTFLNWMLNWYILKRIDGHVFGQTGPFGTHLILILVFFIFFIRFIPAAFYNSFKLAWHKNETMMILVLYWIAGWLFYEFSPSKLPAYVIGAHVPLAFIISKQLEKEVLKTFFQKIMFSIQTLLFSVLAFGLILNSYLFEFPKELKLTAQILGFYLLLWNILMFFTRKNTAFRKWHLLGAFGFVFLAWAQAPKATEIINSSKKVALFITAIDFKGTIHIACNYGNQPSLPYYLKTKNLWVEDQTHLSEDILFQLAKTESSALFLLNRQQYDYFCAQSAATIPAKHIQTYMIDRVGTTDYYVLNSRALHTVHK